MQVDFLLNHPQMIEEVAEMIYTEFVIKSGSNMKHKDVVKHFSRTKDNTFPITLVAIENGECLGTVSIFENDFKSRELYKPWLASLYIKPEYRNRGIGLKLIDRTKQVVRDLGFKELYLRTEDTSNYYRNRGWYYVETVSDENHEKIDIFKINTV